MTPDLRAHLPLLSEDDRLIRAWLRYAETDLGRNPTLGDRLVIGDFSGYRCDGTVRRFLDTDLVEIELDLSTMRVAPQP